MKKAKIISTIFMAVVCICALAFGVYSVKNASMSASGTVKFNASQLEISVDATIEGAINSAGQPLTAYSHKVTNKTGGLANYDPLTTLCDLNDLYFNDIIASTAPEIPVITVKFHIVNYSDYSGYAYFTNNLGDVMHTDTLGDDVSVRLSGRSYISATDGSSSFDELDMKISFTLHEWIQISSGIEFNYTLHVDDYHSVMLPVDAFSTWNSLEYGEGYGENYTAYSLSQVVDVLYLPETELGGDNGFLGQNIYSISVKSPLSYYEDSCGQTSSYVKEVVIPTTWSTISPRMFEYCNALLHITIPSSIESIGNSAFVGCNNLNYIEIPSTVTSIGSNAFVWCNKLIQVRNFSECTLTGLPACFMQEVKTDESAFIYKLVYGSKYITLETEDMIYLMGMVDPYLTTIINDIPSNVTGIYDSAFSGCLSSAGGLISGLRSITVPSTVRFIGRNALNYKTGDIDGTYGLGVSDDVTDNMYYSTAIIINVASGSVWKWSDTIDGAKTQFATSTVSTDLIHYIDSYEGISLTGKILWQEEL